MIIPLRQRGGYFIFPFSRAAPSRGGHHASSTVPANPFRKKENLLLSDLWHTYTRRDAWFKVHLVLTTRFAITDLTARRRQN